MSIVLVQVCDFSMFLYKISSFHAIRWFNEGKGLLLHYQGYLDIFVFYFHDKLHFHISWIEEGVNDKKRVTMM